LNHRHKICVPENNCARREHHEPSAKILALAHLLIGVQRGSIRNNQQRIRLYRIVELIGRSSMVDVFIDTFTAALIQLQPLMSVEPGADIRDATGDCKQ